MGTLLNFITLLDNARKGIKDMASTHQHPKAYMKCKHEDGCVLDADHKKFGFDKHIETEENIPPAYWAKEVEYIAAFSESSSNVYSGPLSKWKPVEQTCRHEATAVFKPKDSEIAYFGGSDCKVNEFEWEGLVVNCLDKDYNSEPELVKGPEAWVKSVSEFVLEANKVKNYLAIDWPDYGAPPIVPGFWKAVNDEAEKQKVGKVLIYCMGGHGRTGTALSAVLIETSGFSAKQAVQWVRQNYCKRAVESKEQKQYLFDLEKHFKTGKKDK